MESVPLHISDTSRRALIENMTEFCASVRKCDPHQALSFICSHDYLKSQVEYYQGFFAENGIDPKVCKVLEVGSGYGFFIAYARKHLRWNIWGLEPGRNEFAGRFALASSILSENGVEAERLINSIGEQIEAESESFDVVISNDVLEHVQNPQAVLSESIRVLKPSGLMIFNVPNYKWIYEGHYNTPWIPAMPKKIAEFYVRLLGRDPSYIKHLNFLTPKILSGLIENLPNASLKHPLDYKSSEFISQRIAAYLKSDKHSRFDAKTSVIKLLYWISINPFFRKLLDQFAKVTGVYHEMHLVAVKSK